MSELCTTENSHVLTNLRFKNDCYCAFYCWCFSYRRIVEYEPPLWNKQGSAGYYLYTYLGSSLAPFPQLSSTIPPTCAICGSAAACRCAWGSTNSAWTATAGSCHFCRWRMESTSYSSPKTWPSKGHTLTWYVFLYTHKLCSRLSPRTIWSWIITSTVQLWVFACVGRVQELLWKQWPALSSECDWGSFGTTPRPGQWWLYQHGSWALYHQPAVQQGPAGGSLWKNLYCHLDWEQICFWFKWINTPCVCSPRSWCSL